MTAPDGTTGPAAPMTADRGRALAAAAVCFLSAALALGLYVYAFRLLQHYEWDQAFIRFVSLAALLGAVLVARLAAGRGPAAPAWAFAPEAAVYAALTAACAAVIVPYVGANLDSELRVDIGQITHRAAVIFAREHRNPYESRTLSVLGDNPDYWGYKYGPVMMLAHLPSAYIGPEGVKYANIVYLEAALACVAVLCYDPRDRREVNRARVLFAVLCLASCEKIYIELFRQGVIDIFPTFLVLLSLVFMKRESWFWAGVAAGLSLAAKPAPAVFVIALQFRKDFRPAFFAGAACGASALVPFLAWAPRAFVNNVLLFHAFKRPDTTSLYSLLPGELHRWISLVSPAAALLVLARNFGSRASWSDTLLWSTALQMVSLMFFKEVHGNHLLWFAPQLAVLFAWLRHDLLPGLARLAGGVGTPPGRRW